MRLQPTLDDHQSGDQAGFKPSYATTDTFSRSSNSDREPPSGTSRCGSQPSTSKVFDTVEHSSVWTCHVPATPTESHRVAPAAVGRSLRPQKSSTQWSTAACGLVTFQQLRQRATEWHQPLWVAAIDFKSLRHSGAQQRVDLSRSSNSDREPPSGTSRCGSQPSTSKVFDTVEHSSVWTCLEGTRHRGTIHVATHKSLRFATSTIAHGKSKQPHFER